MKCLKCGNQTEKMLCEQCMDEMTLKEIFFELLYFREDRCENEYVMNFVNEVGGKECVREYIPALLELFDDDVSEYCWCKYFNIIKDDRYEESAINYIENHSVKDADCQKTLRDLLAYYIPADYEAVEKWCEIVRKEDGLCFELYSDVIKYYSCIGDYDIADELIEKLRNYVQNESYNEFFYVARENAPENVEKLAKTLNNYRTKKPYWPTTEARRRVIAKFYDERGIAYPRIELKPEKVKESDFKPINECFEDDLKNYCAFWCESCYAYRGVKDIYQIAAIKVKDGKVCDKFESFVRPWDSIAARKAAAKQADVTVDFLDSCKDVDQVMKKFFAFVDNDILVSTGALGQQAKLMSRAARYSGINEIKNEFFDLLDMAADVSKEFDLENNTREKLLQAFSIDEGKNAVEKAEINVKIYEHLKKFGE